MALLCASFVTGSTPQTPVSQHPSIMATSLSFISVFLLYMWKMGGFDKGERLGVEPIQRTVNKPDRLYMSSCSMGSAVWLSRQGLKPSFRGSIWRFTEQGMTIPPLRCVTWGGQDAIFKHNVPGYAAHQKHARAVDVHAWLGGCRQTRVLCALDAFPPLLLKRQPATMHSYCRLSEGVENRSLHTVKKKASTLYN